MKQKITSVCHAKNYEKLYRDHAEKIANYLYYKFGDMEKAKDVVQESFAKLWVNCSKIIFENAKSFLYKIANNISINDYNHQKVILKYKSRPQNKITNESPDFQMEEKEFMDKLNQAIANLKEGQREVFLLSRIEKNTYNEIAELLNISVKTVERRMHLALKILRTKIPEI